MDNVRLPMKAYAMQLMIHNNGKMCWVSHISKTLYRFGFGRRAKLNKDLYTVIARTGKNILSIRV